MPRKNRKSKDSEIATKNKNFLSTGLPSPRQEEITFLEGNFSSCSAAVKSEETSNVSEKHEKVVSDVSSHIPEISEAGKSSDGDISVLENDGSSASFLQEVIEIDNSESVKTTDATLTEVSLVIRDDENVAIHEKSSEAFLLYSEQGSTAMKNESVCEQISFTDKLSHSENDVNQEESSEETNLSLNSTLPIDAIIKEDVVCVSKLFNVESSRDDSIMHQEKTSDEATLSAKAFLLDSKPEDHAMKNESVCEQISYTAKSSHSENDANKEKLSDGINLPLDSILQIDATIKEDVVCGSKLFNVEASRDESVIHQEKTSDEVTLSSESAESKIQTIKKASEDEREKTLEVDLNSCSSTTSPPMNIVESNNTELKPKYTSSASSLETLNTDSQFQISSEKGRGKARAQFKHTTDASASEHNRKRAKTSSAVASSKASQKNDNRRDLKRRVKSEQTTTNKSELQPGKTSKEVISSSETSFRAKEGNVGRGRRGRGSRGRGMHRAAARGSITCNTGKGELLTQNKCLLEVSPKQRKRKSTENATSDSPEKALEAIPSKRTQKGSQSLASSTQESKSSSRVKQTSPGLLRTRKNKSASGETTDKPPCTVISTTESITEYLGEAAYWVTRDIPEHTVEESTKRKSIKYEPQVYMPTSTGKSNMIVITQTQSVREYLEIPEDSPTDETPIQPMMGVLSKEVSSIGAEHLSTASSILDINLNMADVPATESVKSSTETVAERSPTVSSSENIEADIYSKKNSNICRGAGSKMSGKNTQEIFPQSGYTREYVADRLAIQLPESSTEADRLSAISSREDVKETHSHCEQSSSTICRGARPKTRNKNNQISPRRWDDSGRPGLVLDTAGSQSNNNELYPSFAEFKETLGVDKVKVVDINKDVFDRALGYLFDRSSDHSAPEHRQEFKIKSPKCSEAVSYDDGKNLKSIDSGTSSNDPQSSEMVKKDFLPTLEEFRNTLRLHEFPPFRGNLLEMFDRALEEMESEKQKLQPKKVEEFLISKGQDPSTSRRTSSERQIDEVTSQNAGSSRPCINYELISSDEEFTSSRSDPVEVAQEFPTREVLIIQPLSESSESTATNSDKSNEN